MHAPVDLVFSAEEKTELLGLARRTLEACVQGDSEATLRKFLKAHTQAHPWCAPYPCFVSLFTPNHRLRGCIGCTETGSGLAQNVHRYTQLAALEDPRFDPVRPDEATSLSLRISVLGPSYPLPDLGRMIIGLHGLSIRKLPRHGVLLAQVAKEFGWSPERFLAETYRKAGLTPGEAGCDIRYFEEVEFSEI